MVLLFDERIFEITAQQPEALRLADLLESRTTPWPVKAQAASELRRLHAENITLQSSTAPADVAGTSERWRERWHGSPTEQGWSIMYGRECIAYLGPDVSSEAVSAIVAAHNAAPTTQAAPAAQGDAEDTARSLFDERVIN